jgi:hypothetical protein
VVLDARMAAISGPWAEDSADECEAAGPSQPDETRLGPVPVRS